MIRNTDADHWLPTRHLSLACDVAREDPALLRSLFGITSPEVQALLARLPVDAVKTVAGHAGLLLKPVPEGDVEHAIAETANGRVGAMAAYGRWQQVIVEYQHDLLVILAKSYPVEPDVCAEVLNLSSATIAALAAVPAHQMRTLASWPLFLQILVTPAFVSLLRACGDSGVLTTPISMAALGLCALGQRVENKAVR